MKTMWGIRQRAGIVLASCATMAVLVGCTNQAVGDAQNAIQSNSEVAAESQEATEGAEAERDASSEEGAKAQEEIPSPDYTAIPDTLMDETLKKYVTYLHLPMSKTTIDAKSDSKSLGTVQFAGQDMTVEAMYNSDTVKDDDSISSLVLTPSSELSKEELGYKITNMLDTAYWTTNSYGSTIRVPQTDLELHLSKKTGEETLRSVSISLVDGKDDRSEVANKVTISSLDEISDSVFDASAKEALRYLDMTFAESGLQSNEAYGTAFRISNCRVAGEETYRTTVCFDSISSGEEKPYEVHFSITNPMKSDGKSETRSITRTIAKGLGISSLNTKEDPSVGYTYAVFDIEDAGYSIFIENTDGTVDIDVMRLPRE